MRYFHFAALSLLPILVSCSMFTRRDTKTNATSTYDVPVAARGPGGQMKKRLLVLPFLDEKIARSESIRDLARRAVVTELNRTEQFVIVKNSDFPIDLGKYRTEKNEYNLNEVAKMASGMGISAIVEGKIIDIKAKRLGDAVGLFREIKARVDSTIRLRVASAKTGKILFSDSRSSAVESTTTRVAKYSYSDRFLEEDPNLVRKAVVKTARRFIGQIARSVDKVSWEGRVAMVNGEKIYINAGRLSGIQVGDILKVTEEGPEIYDPETGRFIGNAPGRMKGTLEVISYFGKDGSISIIHSGSGFAENDRVELY
jgi:hypothetical protein